MRFGILATGTIAKKFAETVNAMDDQEAALAAVGSRRIEAAEEFARVVKPGGFFLYAVPGERHLYGLKELLYENPYENPHRETEYPGFRFVGRTAVRGEIRVPDSQTAVDLFTMTPYYWKTGPQAAQRLETVEGFSTEIGFDFLLYQRK